MSITGSQLEQIQEALLAAFDEVGLKRLCAFELDADFDHIAEKGPLPDRVFALIEWAKQHSAVPRLIAAAYSRNPSNAELQLLLVDAQEWPDCKAAGLVALDGRASVFASRHVELKYLESILSDYELWAQKYTPLAGIAEVADSGARRPRLLAPDSFLPPEFALLGREGSEASSNVERRPVSDLRQAVKEHQRLVVLGEPGSGKTTTLQILRREYALVAKDDRSAPLPVLVALGGYSGDESALECAIRRAGDLGRHLLAYLHAGRAVLLLDALNEMPQRDYHERVKRIQSLINHCPTASVVVTCRALDYSEALNLRKLEIKPLDVNRQREYLHRYLGEADGDMLFWRLAGGEEVAALWRAWEHAGGNWDDFWQAENVPAVVYGRTTEEQDALWRRLRAGELSSLLALSVNPYMLAMLIDLYGKGGGTLPQNGAELCTKFVGVLFSRERDRRQKSGALWPGNQALHDSLAQLAFAMQSAGERKLPWTRRGRRLSLPRSTDRLAHFCLPRQVQPCWMFQASRCALYIS